MDEELKKSIEIGKQMHEAICEIAIDSLPPELRSDPRVARALVGPGMRCVLAAVKLADKHKVKISEIILGAVAYELAGAHKPQSPQAEAKDLASSAFVPPVTPRFTNN